MALLTVDAVLDRIPALDCGQESVVLLLEEKLLLADVLHKV